MKHAMQLVVEFHRKHGAPVLDHVATPEEIEARRVLRMDLITEECVTRAIRPAPSSGGGGWGEPAPSGGPDECFARAVWRHPNGGAALRPMQGATK